MTEKKTFNLGWAILKLWMCYEVVLVHAWNSYKPELVQSWEPGWMLAFFASLRPYCVPVFMTIAFFLAAEKFAAGGGEWLRKRFTRLLVPWVFWTLLAFITWKLLALGGATGPYPYPWDAKAVHPPFATPLDNLGWQLLLGTTREYGSQMWFQAVLVIETAIFACFFRFLKSGWRTWGLSVLFFGALVAEYSGLNFYLFKDMIYEVKNPLGRIIPMIPYAAMGLFFGLRQRSLEGFSTARRWGIVAMASLLAVFMVVNDKNVIFAKPQGFYYTGLTMLAIAFALVTAFRFLPCEGLPDDVKAVIVKASKYSMGVYFAHIYVGRLLETLVFPGIGVVPRSFTAACVVFAVSFALCVLGSLIPGRRVKMLFQ